MSININQANTGHYEPTCEVSPLGGIPTGSALARERSNNVTRKVFRCGRYRVFIEGICANCQKPCLLKKSPDSRFCSRSCGIGFRSRKNIGPLNSNWKGGISKNHYHYKKLQMERYPERVKAREAVYQAIKSGKLVRGCCEHSGCGKPNADAHHDDYSKPLDVRWFCQEHHSKIHPDNRNAAKLTPAGGVL